LGGNKNGWKCKIQQDPGAISYRIGEDEEPDDKNDFLDGLSD
jgi:hypothetical protein